MWSDIVSYIWQCAGYQPIYCMNVNLIWLYGADYLWCLCIWVRLINVPESFFLTKDKTRIGNMTDFPF